MGMPEQAVMFRFLYLVFLFGKVTDLRIIAILIAYKMKGVDMAFYDV
jgi:anthranilate phosphoribosyltransferase